MNDTGYQPTTTPSEANCHWKPADGQAYTKWRLRQANDALQYMSKNTNFEKRSRKRDAGSCELLAGAIGFRAGDFVDATKAGRHFVPDRPDVDYNSRGDKVKDWVKKLKELEGERGGLDILAHTAAARHAATAVTLAALAFVEDPGATVVSASSLPPSS